MKNYWLVVASAWKIAMQLEVAELSQSAYIKVACIDPWVYISSDRIGR